MAIFELSVDNYDEHSYWLFEHEKKTPKQFEDDCHKAILAVGDDVIAKEHFYVSVYDWLEAIVPVLEAWDYKYIRPANVSFRSERLNCVDGESEWRGVIGEELYNKAIKTGFERWIAYHADTYYFILASDGMSLYHQADCSILRENWHQQIFDFPKESLPKNEYGLGNCQPCSVCVGEEKS